MTATAKNPGRAGWDSQHDEQAQYTLVLQSCLSLDRNTAARLRLVRRSLSPIAHRWAPPLVYTLLAQEELMLLTQQHNFFGLRHTSCRGIDCINDRYRKEPVGHELPV